MKCSFSLTGPVMVPPPLYSGMSLKLRATWFPNFSFLSLVQAMPFSENGRFCPFMDME